MSSRFGSPLPPTASELAMRKKRRYQSLSDEQIHEEMDQRGLSYRFGWPELPPLPVTTMTRGAQNAVEGGVARLEEAQNILRLQRIHVSDIFFAYRVPQAAKIEADQELDGYLTLVITADTTLPDMFLQALTRIRQRFKTQEPTQNVSIEIIDHRALDNLHTIPVRPSDKAIHDSWPEVMMIVHNEITAHDEKWLCIEAAHRGVVASSCVPTIMITTPTAESEVWTKFIMPALRVRLRTVKPHFQLEILYGVTLFATRTSPNITIGSYDEKVTMGASIGIRGDPKSAGTLGGVVRLSDDRAYGLTNHHVIRDERIDDILRHDGQSMLQPGNHSLEKESHSMNSPADCDHAAFMAGLDNQNSFWTTQKSKGDTQAEAELERNATLRAAAKTSPRTLGNLFASSGPRIMTSAQFPGPTTRNSASEYRFLLDWGLIEVISPRMAKNRLSRADINLDGTTTQLFQGQICDTWSPLNVGKTNIKTEDVQVAKCGRTSGWTFGTISGIVTMINPAQDPTFKEMVKPYGLTGALPGYCYSVISRGKRDFFEPGDSGSVIVHDSILPAWVGLLFGESAAFSGLMISMDMVIKDIENVTGSVVVEPKRDDNP